MFAHPFPDSEGESAIPPEAEDTEMNQIWPLTAQEEGSRGDSWAGEEPTEWS